MVKRNVEGSENEMRKAWRSRAWRRPLPIRLRFYR